MTLNKTSRVNANGTVLGVQAYPQIAQRGSGRNQN